MAKKGFLDRLEDQKFVTGSLFWFLGLLVIFMISYLVITKQFDITQTYDLLKILIGMIIGGIAGKYGSSKTN